MCGIFCLFQSVVLISQKHVLTWLSLDVTGHYLFFGASLGGTVLPMSSPGTSPGADQNFLPLLNWALNLQSTVFSQ